MPLGDQMRLYRTAEGAVVEEGGALTRIPDPWDDLLCDDALAARLRRRLPGAARLAGTADRLAPLPPVGQQEVWGAGVTYAHGRDRCAAEGREHGGGDCYDRVFRAARPELFFKATAARVVGPGQPVTVRRDSVATLPEPELALVISPRGVVVGFTVANDLTARDLEAENPLYLPQAKIWAGSCALGPAILVAEEPLPPATPILLSITRAGAPVFAGRGSLADLARGIPELVEHLYRELDFPRGCVLMTGAAVLPQDRALALRPGDSVRVVIPPIGALINPVAACDPRAPAERTGATAAAAAARG